MNRLSSIFIFLSLFTSEAQADLSGNRSALDAIEKFCPETALELAVTSSREWREGVVWGEPRYGHPGKCR